MMLRVLVFILPLALFGCGSTSENNQSSAYATPSNVAVLNYYPNCPYQVLGEVTGFSGISASEHQQLKNNPTSAKISAEFATNSVDEAISQTKASRRKTRCQRNCYYRLSNNKDKNKDAGKPNSKSEKT